VQLTAADRTRLRTLGGSGTAPARRLTRARILLTADQGEGGAAWADAAIAGALRCIPRPWPASGARMWRPGLDAGLARQRPDRVYARALDGAAEAHLVAVACSAPPAGRERWTLRLLADELVRLEVVNAVSYEPGRRTIAQTR
jgi:hypothetical protein